MTAAEKEKDYGFSEAAVYEKTAADWKAFSAETGCGKIVIGVSGGKDSTCETYLAARLVGRENVYGVLMPNGEQKDITDAERVVAETGVNRLEINIGKAYEELEDAFFCNGGLRMSEAAKTNLPPRIRMAALYMVAQTAGGIVFCSDNRSEAVTGYSTLFGDGAGSYSPIKDLTTVEVVKLGKWLGAPADLMDKKPGDGLQPLGDEERIGMSYADLHQLIRYGEGSREFKARATARYAANKFKLGMVRIRGPEFGFPDYFRGR